MADKILSLASIKKCLEKVKELLGMKADKTELDSYVNTYTKNNANANELLSPGFYRLQSNNTNVPTGGIPNYGNWGNIVTVRKGNEGTLAQIYFSSRNTTVTNYFAARWGGISADLPFSEGPWLYFLGSTSPNIPMQKKKTITGTTTKNGNIDTTLKKESAIILSAYAYDIGVAYYAIVFSLGSKLYLKIKNYEEPDSSITSTNVTVDIFYLEIPSDYTIPEDTTAVSDEPEDDIGILQANEAEQEIPHAEE